MQAHDRFYGTQDDFRDPFDRDRDRIIHSSYFRKLEYKTQVFLNQHGDFFRTRLTHSLEVSQIARTLAKALNLSESLAEAIALAHDLGHTPFGHVGGDELDAILKEYRHENGFEHNFQSFRVVTKLEKNYKDHDGLNLTFASLCGILKHSVPYDKSFLTDDIRDEFNIDYHPSLEALIVDRADEIAYITHDIEDGIVSSLISFDDLKDSILVQMILEKVDRSGIDKSNKKIYTYSFRTQLISYLIISLLEFSKKNIVDLSKDIHIREIGASFVSPIRVDDELEQQIKELKTILFEKLYKHHYISRKMHAGKTAIRRIFEAVYDDCALLPFKEKQRANSLKKHRVIADFIASLSDREAMSFYKEIYAIDV